MAFCSPLLRPCPFTEKNSPSNGALRYESPLASRGQLRFTAHPKRRTYVDAPAHLDSARLAYSAMCAHERALWKRTGASPSKLAVLVSGGGRSLENLCERINSGSLTGCELTLVVASKKTAGAIQRAERYGVPTRVLRLQEFDGKTEDYSDAISTLLDDYDVDLVVLAGWMHFYLIPERYRGKVINIHPSLIPSFCGKGYYGHHVHEAVLAFGAKVTGCTVHLADNEYDHGPIILQKAVPVFASDTAGELAARVFESEKEALPEALQLFVDGRLSVEGRVIRVRTETL